MPPRKYYYHLESKTTVFGWDEGPSPSMADVEDALNALSKEGWTGIEESEKKACFAKRGLDFDRVVRYYAFIRHLNMVIEEESSPEYLAKLVELFWKREHNAKRIRDTYNE